MQAQSVGCLVFALALLLAPITSWAQGAATSAIAGLVRDSSGAVLPGATVEAASPALIEKVRTAVTDGQGLYQIVDLRPGTYVVTVSLPGFGTVRREGVELEVGFTATVNAELRVGAVEETITVSGTAPLVDTRNVIQRTTLPRETLDALPTIARTASYMTLLPGATGGTQDVGGLSGERGATFGIHGGRSNEININQDGMNITMLAIASSSFNPYAMQEIGLETTGNSADTYSAGVRVNLVPKDGGNTFSGSFGLSFGTRDLQSENLTDELRARGLRATPSLKKSYDVGGGFGGPLRQDKLWFFTAHRRWVASRFIPGLFHNARQGTLFYEPDRSRPAFTKDFYRDHTLRLTWQISQKDKFAISMGGENNCNCPNENLASSTTAPEAGGDHFYTPNYRGIASWSRPATNRLLLEAGSSLYITTINSKRRPGSSLTDIAVNDQGLGITYGARAGNVTNGIGNPCCYSTQFVGNLTNQRVALSYITGSHAFKTGFSYQFFTFRNKNQSAVDQIHGARAYVFRNQVPVSVTIYATPFGRASDSTSTAAFVQDQWTIRRWTLTGGIRYDTFNAVAVAQSFSAGFFVPAREFPEVQDVPTWKNVSPRLGVAYDLFGTGRTALKASLGRYVLGTSSSGNNNVAISQPILNQANQATRTWNDANRNFVPDCVLGPEVPGANGECGPLSDLKFGQVITAERGQAGNTRFADDVLSGFQDAQEYNWQGSVSVQHELWTGVGVNVAYFRTWYGNFQATDNLAVTPEDFDPFCITAPVDPRLPGGGGNQICGLYDIRPTAFGRVDNLVTQARNYGERTQVFDGIDATVRARFGRGSLLQGGLSTGRTETDNCIVIDSPQQLYQCRVSPPWSAATQLKFLAVYPLPWSLRASVVYQNLPGTPIQASFVATNAQIAPSLGRNLGACRGAAVCNATTTINLIQPESEREDRYSQVDLRFARIFRVRGINFEANLDLYNALNASPVLNMNTRFGPQWLNANEILAGRVVKLGAQVNF